MDIYYTLSLYAFDFVSATCSSIICFYTYIRNKYIQTTLEPFGKHTFKLSFYHQNIKYDFLLPIKRGPKPDIQIIDERGRDMSSFLGPNKDGYGLGYTPNMLKCRMLKLYIDGLFMKTIQEDETIINK